ncbi:MAG: fructose-6-phosphate aldolase [Methylococcaceae bacterium]|nr:fructose-6-phosphate aldolase [Methylococcaceae bacterium]
MLELYLDTANLQQIEELAPILPLRGVTTNPSIMAAGGLGLNALLPKLESVLGKQTRIHVQVLSNSVDGIIEEASQLHALPYDIVVKIPAHANGLAAIKQIKQATVPVLATAIYSKQQAIIAALNGADYLAPYLNRIDNLGFDSLEVIDAIQNFLERYQLPSQLLVASFKNLNQVLSVLDLGVGAVTLPTDIARQFLNHQSTELAVDKFNSDWQLQFSDKLSYQT